MDLGPIRNTLMVNAQLATNSPQIHPIHIELHSLPTKLYIVTVRLLLRRVFTTTPITPIALAPRWELAHFVLFFFTSTFWTFHPLILPTLSPLPKSHLFWGARSQQGCDQSQDLFCQRKICMEIMIKDDREGIHRVHILW